MDGLQLREILSKYGSQYISNAFRGVMWVDTFIAQAKDRVYPGVLNAFIVNTLTAAAPPKLLGHWLYIEIGPYDHANKRMRVLYFDSYGEPPQYYSAALGDFLLQYGEGVLDFSPLRIQSDLTRLCGMYCIFVAFNLRHRQRLSDLIAEEFGGGDLVENDRKLLNWVQTTSFAHLLQNKCPQTASHCITPKDLLF